MDHLFKQKMLVTFASIILILRLMIILPRLESVLEITGLRLIHLCQRLAYQAFQ